MSEKEWDIACTIFPCDNTCILKCEECVVQKKRVEWGQKKVTYQ